jgi:hypothetical protein
MTKKNTGARWEITVDGKPRSYDRNKQLAIEVGTVSQAEKSKRRRDRARS